MTRADMDKAVADFVRATRFAEEAGFDLIEVHMAHGYLLSTFISPLSNLRKDAYGGDIHGRLKFPLELLTAVRQAWPQHKPISVRISASDWAEGGLTDDERLTVARSLQKSGADIIDCSAGGVVPHQKPVYGRMFQVPFSEHIRLEGGVPTMAVGNIQDVDQANTILAAGRADLVAMARPHLTDPYVTLHAAAQYDAADFAWPKQYLRARPAVRKGGRD
jgi:anthraniloyl-CoA monooxygenase